MHTYDFVVLTPRIGFRSHIGGWYITVLEPVDALTQLAEGKASDSGDLAALLQSWGYLPETAQWKRHTFHDPEYREYWTTFVQRAAQPAHA